MRSAVINKTKRAAFKQQFNIKLPKKITFPMPVPQRPTVAQVRDLFIQKFKGKTFHQPITRNKGLSGIFLENLLDIPNSTACLDCCDGELKLFPLKKLKNGQLSPKETVAITMRGLRAQEIHDPKPWQQSDLKKKTHNLLFISYTREGDNITYLDECLFGASESEYTVFGEDYNLITDYYKTHGICQLSKDDPAHRSNTINGTYIQGRTKGGGKKVGNGKRTCAFYFRSKFIKDIILRNINLQSAHQSSSQQDS
jgi:hypothetical protein